MSEEMQDPQNFLTCYATVEGLTCEKCSHPQIMGSSLCLPWSLAWEERNGASLSGTDSFLAHAISAGEAVDDMSRLLSLPP